VTFAVVGWFGLINRSALTNDAFEASLVVARESLGGRTDAARSDRKKHR